MRFFYVLLMQCPLVSRKSLADKGGNPTSVTQSRNKPLFKFVKLSTGCSFRSSLDFTGPVQLGKVSINFFSILSMDLSTQRDRKRFGLVSLLNGIRGLFKAKAILVKEQK